MNKPPWIDIPDTYQKCYECEERDDDLQAVYCKKCAELGIDSKLYLIDKSEPSGEPEDLEDR